MIQAVVLDLDGTLLDQNHQIPDFNLKVLSQLRQKGVRVFIATGRTWTSMMPYYQELELNTPIICYNGAKRVYPNGDVIEQGLTDPQVRFLIDLAHQHQIHLNLYKDELWYTEHPHSSWAQEYAHISGLVPHKIDFSTLSSSSSSSLKDLSSTKVLFLGNRPDLLKLVPLIQARWGEALHSTSSKYHFLEVLKAGVNKGTALHTLFQEEGIDANQVIAFGDGLNDLEMLQYVGMGIAMDNGFDELKQVAFDLTVSNQEAGVGRYLERFL